MLQKAYDRTAENGYVKSGSIVPHTGTRSPARVGTKFVFADVARDMGADVGRQLHKLTDYPERSCYRYASGESEPPYHFLRLLLSSDIGERFFLAFMDGCNAPWWAERERHRKMGAAADMAST